MGSAPAQAQAADQIVAHDTLILRVWALDGDLVYNRRGKTLPKRVWMARFRGHLRQARGIPRQVYSGELGRDANGRKVFTFGTWRQKNGRIVSTKWFAYDLAKNRGQRLHGLPAGCTVFWVSLWRGSSAYSADCKKPAKSGLFLKQGKRTRLVSTDPGGSPVVFRRGTLAVLFDTGLDDFVVRQFTAGGKPCGNWIGSSYGDATSEYGWYPNDLWATGGGLTWVMGSPRFRHDFAILAAKVPSSCGKPEPIGQLPFTPETATVQTLTVDGLRVFYSDGKTLRLHTVPAVSYAPPANDDFENARQLPSQPPFNVTGPSAYATVQSGEPLADTKHTIWYAYRPATSGTVYVSVYGNPIWDFEQNHYVGTYSYRVYTGTSRDRLTEIPHNGATTRVDAVAGQTYWICVGSAVPDPNYQPIDLSVQLTPPSG